MRWCSNPNCVVAFHGSTVQVRALRSISADEELTIQYTDLYLERGLRRQRLASSHCFECCESRGSDPLRLVRVAAGSLTGCLAPCSVRAVRGRGSSLRGQPDLRLPLRGRRLRRLGPAARTERHGGGLDLHRVQHFACASRGRIGTCEQICWT